MRKFLAVFLGCLIVFGFAACVITREPADTARLTPDPSVMAAQPKSTDERVAAIIAAMSLEEKAGQMVQGEQYAVSAEDITKLGLGSVFSGGGSVPDNNNTVTHWQTVMKRFQQAALCSATEIPLLYGLDAVHGHNTVYGAVIFPHNIGIGAANDTALTERMGAYVAGEMMLTRTPWNFGPCVAVAQDPRWGRTYESYSSDPELVSELASAYVKGLQGGGVLATAKHYAGDGGALYGTGEGDYLIDRGDAEMNEEQFRAIHLAPYKRLVDEGLMCVMVSFSSYNGVKMHENRYLITDVLKGEFGFKGFVVSDWEGTTGIPAPDFEAQIAAAVNAGIDMLMEPYKYKEAIQAIIHGVEKGVIPMERVDDAVSRILTVKLEMRLFDNPYLEKATAAAELNGQEGCGIARELVRKSLVLLKNEGGVLPLKRGQKVYVTGPAADNIGVQCGGWTLSWQGIPDKELTPGMSILQGLQECADEYGFEVITDKTHASEADVVLLALGEKPYAEYEGDTEDLSLTGALGLEGNAEAIAEAAALGKPTVAVIVAGRNVLIDEYLDGWDGAVMGWLPGTEGGGVVDMLAGAEPFTGRLPMPWYRDVEDIGKADADLLFEMGYGLSLEQRATPHPALRATFSSRRRLLEWRPLLLV